MSKTSSRLSPGSHPAPLRKILESFPVLAGSLVKQYVVCGKPGAPVVHRNAWLPVEQGPDPQASQGGTKQAILTSSRLFTRFEISMSQTVREQ